MSLVAEIVVPAGDVQDIDRRGSVRVAHAAPVAMEERRHRHDRDPYRRCGRSRKCEPRDRQILRARARNRVTRYYVTLGDGRDIMML